MNKRQVGGEYESLAASYLEGKGYTILERNYRNRYGEIDIIARTGDTLVFVEIKYRSSTSCGNPEEAVDYRKQKRISKVAMYYYTFGGYGELDCRFDVIAILEGEIRHIENAFSYVGD